MRGHMNVNISGLIGALCCVMMLSCTPKDGYQRAALISYDDFSSTQKLIGTNLQFDDTILKPMRIQVFDSLLFTVNTREEKLIHVFNLKSQKKIGERISSGQGPGEMLQPYFVKIDTAWVHLFDMSSFTLYVYATKDFITNPLPVVIRKVKLSEPTFGEIRLLGNDMVSSAYNPNNQFISFNSNGEKSMEFGTYPISNNAFSDAEKVEAYKSSFTTNQKDRIAVCYNWTDLIDILDGKGHLKKRIHGPKQFISTFKEFRDGDVVSASPVKGHNRDAYFCPISVGGDLFVLFSGKAEDEADYSMLANQMFVFDWDGNPKQILLLDQGIFAFTVDKENKKIYGISDKPDFHLVAFSYN